MIKSILLSLLLVSCATSGERPDPVLSAEQALLEEKANRYINLIHSEGHQDGNGFILTDKCDALIFSGLYGAAVPGSVDILAARDDTGAWHRRPGFDCSPSIGNSRSTVSRDMILGLFWHLWKNKRLVVAIELMDDLKRNGYKLRGQGTLGELLLNPSMIGTLAHIILKLGGPRYSFELALPAVFSKHEGFKAHLTVWHILLRASLLNKMPSKHLDILKFNHDRNPQNPLFQAAYHKWKDGNQIEAINGLLNTSLWPDSSLPTSDNYCAEWVVQRDFEPKDWGPCPEKARHHTGAELVAIYYLIIKGS